MNSAHQQDRPDAPQSFGRYRIRGVLGEGGMGRLYVAEQTGIEGFTKIVAVKRILPHLADSIPFRTLFLNEARIAARLEHPNIVATYELGSVEGTYFIAMEYLPGEDLAAILARCEAPGGMPVEVAALLAQQSANGLSYAHQLRDAEGRPVRLVHRDVNPSNIFVTYHGMVKLLDFGVVKATSAASPPGKVTTGAGVFKGKYAYCAPEQLQGETIDHRSDVFSLGIVLWECLTGHRLFDSSTEAGTIDAVRGHVIVAPSLLRPEVPFQLDEICMRALVRDRQRRYQSAIELSEALDRFLGSQRVRPTTNRVGQWLEGLFGSERASLKKAIAQGNGVEAALAKLTLSSAEAAASQPAGVSAPPPTSRSTVRPRPLWSTAVERPPGGGLTPARVATAVEPAAAEQTQPGTPSFVVPAVIPAPPPPPVAAAVARPAVPAVEPAIEPAPDIDRTPRSAPAWRPWMVTVAVATAVVAVIGTAVWILPRARHATDPGSTAAPAVSAPLPAAAGTGSLDIDSDPPGAGILVDGDPVGLTTPATIRDLRVGRAVEIRLDRAGYAPATRQIEVLAGAGRRHLFRLVESMGNVQLTGVPAGAIVYVDDALTDSKRPFSTSVGPHRIRVEADNDVFFSDTVEVRAGKQSVRIAPGGKGALPGAPDPDRRAQ